MAARLMSLASRSQFLRAKPSTLLQKKNAGGPDVWSPGHEKFWREYVNYYTKVCSIGLIIWPMSIFVALEIEEVLEETRPEYKNYIHMRIRKKDLPFYDGVKSLFHDPYFNALPEVGYETADDENPYVHH